MKRTITHLAVALAAFGIMGCGGDGNDDEDGDEGGSGCDLRSCSIDGFTYSCGSGSYSASTSYDYSGAETRIDATIEYSNGHVVHCNGTASNGSCDDDSGASCSW